MRVVIIWISVRSAGYALIIILIPMGGGLRPGVVGVAGHSGHVKPAATTKICPLRNCVRCRYADCGLGAVLRWGARGASR